MPPIQVLCIGDTIIMHRHRYRYQYRAQVSAVIIISIQITVSCIGTDTRHEYSTCSCKNHGDTTTPIRSLRKLTATATVRSRVSSVGTYFQVDDESERNKNKAECKPCSAKLERPNLPLTTQATSCHNKAVVLQWLRHRTNNLLNVSRWQFC